MPDSKNQNLNNVRDLSSKLEEEEDLWDLNDEWEEESPQVADDEPVTTESEHQPQSDVQVQKIEPAEPTAVASDDLPDDGTATVEEISIETPQPFSTRNIEKIPEAPAETHVEDSLESKSNTSDASSTLSWVEKISLSLVAALLISLAIYSYAWLYKKNLNDDVSLKLPIKGQFVTITQFETYWTAKNHTSDTKGHAKILPATRMTLDQDANASGALRLYFRDKEQTIIGDPITLAIENSKFVDNGKSNVTITNDGASVEVVASNGFNQEGDFSAYVLDSKLAWKVLVFEASGATAPGLEFKNNQMIEIKVEPNRE